MDHEIAAVVANAHEWAHARLGSIAYATRCLAFVEDAIERPNDLEVFGGDSAAESAAMFGAIKNTGSPPAGSFAFYQTTGRISGVRAEWGHVGLAVGDGRVIHAWDRVRSDHYREIERLTPAAGWTSPRWLGWVPLDTILATARPRRWADDAPAEQTALSDQRSLLDQWTARDT